jgi:pyruvate dehydrogenase E2 component (dihydrolipoamide acetyltransferase)
VAQKLADEKGVDLSGITGSGPGGRIMVHDVEEALAGAAGPPTPAAAPPVDRALRMRQGIAAAMSRSHREIPHFHIESVIDMSRAIAWLTEENARRTVARRLIYGVLIVKAAALALKKVPELNAVWAEDHVDLRPEIHVGVAILPGGLSRRRSTHRGAVARELMTLRDRCDARAAACVAQGRRSTITVTSLGEEGAEASSA